MQRRMGLILVAAIVVALAAACQSEAPATPANLSDDRAVPEIQVGRADPAEGAISITTADWTYAVPLDGVTWVDAAGTIHDSGRPDCLAAGASRQIRFAAVEVTIDGSRWRPVVWVSCQ